jgi:RimJ/RimL family protein N-acetyltransferase
VTLEGGTVTLRAFRPEEAELVHLARSTQIPASGPSLERLRERMASSGRVVGGRLDLAIEVQGRLVGELEARQPKEALPPGVYEIGIGLFYERDKSKGYGREACALFTDLLFEAHEAERVQASTWVDNRPMRKVLERLGFVYEGTMRGFMPSRRGRDDYAMYGITRAERAAARDAARPDPS